MKAKRNEGDTARGNDDLELQLSSLLDGEVDDNTCRSLLERLRRDGEAGRDWELLNCVGDAMRSSDVAAWHRPGFVSRVSAALEKEPTVLAPAALPRTGLRRWMLPGAGVAAAAAVLLAIGLPRGQFASPVDLASSAPASLQVRAAAPAGPMQVDRSPVLERYLAAHRELADPTVMPFSTPYVRTSGAILSQENR
jgi:negative regulator of sigma E activity